MGSRAGRLGRIGGCLGLLCALVLLCSASAAAGASAVSVSPLNGTPDASPFTQISFLGVPANQISRVSVNGSRTGRHSGRLSGYVSAPGASFLLSHPFTQGETVTASAVVGAKGHTQTVRTRFTVERFANYRVTAGKPLQLKGHGMEQSFQTQPQLKPPVVSV
ncbi:MAG: hypothetical protein QOK19_1747, partial [Solirubrobacteraceae bacterium]|nr:hypothetical protein [Solirubrobacteraceae bacterium]